MASEIILDDVVTAYGDYYIANESNRTRLREEFRVPSETAASLTRVPTTNTKEKGIMVTQSSVLQGFQPTWTPYGNVEFLPHDIDLFEQKIDITYTAADLAKIERSYLGFLADLDTPDRGQWPFIRYMMEVHILQTRNQDYELLAIYKGSYVAPTAGTPSPAGQSMDGLKKLINKAISDGYGSSIALGAVPTDPVAFVDYVEAFWEGIPEIVQPFISGIEMNRALRRRFRAGMRMKYNENYQQTGDLLSLIDDNVPVKGLHSMAGSNKIWATIRGNGVEFTKRPISENVFKVEVDKRSVNIYTDWWKGIGFNDPRYVFSNDVELS